MNKIAPILIIFFNRPDTLTQVLDEVALAEPDTIYFFQDGKRNDSKTDDEKCSKCRDIIDSYNWTCKVKKRYLSENVGCGLGPKMAIDWLFENEEEGIILEDDCVPSQSFFRFCTEMLEKYRYDKRIFMITGCNMELKTPISSSYFFGYSGTNWGWASWKRNWSKMDYSCSFVNNREAFKRLQKFMSKEFGKKGKKEVKCLIDTNREIKAGENISYWDVQWQSLRYLSHQLSIIPSVNLITNIGVGESSTHATNLKQPNKLHNSIGKINFCFNEKYELDFPLIDPVDMIPNIDYDDKMNRKLYGSVVHRILSKIILKLKTSACFKKQI